MRPKSRLPRQPKEESLKRLKRGIEGRLAQVRPAAGTDLGCQGTLEGDGLLVMKGAKISEARVRLKAVGRTARY